MPAGSPRSIGAPRWRPLHGARGRPAVHVWVDETRPRNQGAALTAFELGKHGVPHTVIADNAGGHLMQRGAVDLAIVGTDRVTRTGDVANKIGTYLKALAARDNGVPFWVAVPSSTIDWTIANGFCRHPDRGAQRGRSHASDRPDDGRADRSVRLMPEQSQPPIPLSTSRQPGLSPASSPSVAAARRASRVCCRCSPNGSSAVLDTLYCIRKQYPRGVLHFADPLYET